jgi:hypothetical protein
VERQHNITKYNRVFARIASFRDHQEAIPSSKQQSFITTVGEILDKASSRSKRMLSWSTTERKQNANGGQQAEALNKEG